MHSSKTLALVSYLALERGPHPREALATLLWGDSPESAARASLRQALKQLREAVTDAVSVGRHTVELVRPFECDVDAFLAAADTDAAAAAQFAVPRFLEGITVRHAPGFEEWLAGWRGRLLMRYQQVLRACARAAFEHSHWREAWEWADRWLACDSLSEDAALIAIEARYLAGNRSEALAQFTTFRKRLADELGSAPGESIAALARRIAADGRGEAAKPGTTVAPSGPAFAASMIGREQQWRQMTQAWDRVRSGNGSIVLIEGEAGVGKTRLADEFLRWATAEGGIALQSLGYDPRSGLPYGPVVEALRGVLDAPGLAGTPPDQLTEATRVLPELRRRFPKLPEPAPPTDAAERWRLFEALAQLVLAVAAERPTAILIDDFQWCDGETCALLHFLIRRFEHSPVAFVATITQGEIERDAPSARLVRALRIHSGATVVTLARLGEKDVLQMIREMAHITGTGGGRRFAEKVFAVTEGNPFYVVELLKTLFAQGLLTVNETTGEWVAADPSGQPTRKQMPPTVRDAIAQRVGRLPYELRDLMAAIAVAGSAVRTELLSHIHGISRLRAAALADALVERQLVTTDEGTYRCAHPLIADVVREELTAARRREVHRAVAIALESVTRERDLREIAGDIARHAHRGGEGAMAHKYAVLASRAAVDRYAFDEALSWLDLAASHSDDETETNAVNRLTADVLERAGWTEPPRRQRRAGTPALGIQQMDLDLAADEALSVTRRG